MGGQGKVVAMAAGTADGVFTLVGLIGGECFLGVSFLHPFSFSLSLFLSLSSQWLSKKPLPSCRKENKSAKL